MELFTAWHLLLLDELHIGTKAKADLPAGAQARAVQSQGKQTTPACRQPSSGLGLAPGLVLFRRPRTDQIRRLPRLAEHLKEHLG